MLYLGTNIKEYRLKKGYTQEQLAYELGVLSKRSVVGRLELLIRIL